jgi:hypothetical protein
MLQKSKMATQGDNNAQSQMVVGTWRHYKAQLGKVSCGIKWPQTAKNFQSIKDFGSAAEDIRIKFRFSGSPI